MKRQHEIGPYWQDDWLCTIEFLPGDDPEGRLFSEWSRLHIKNY